MDHLFEEQEVFQVEKLRFRVDEAPEQQWDSCLEGAAVLHAIALSLWLIVTQTRKVGHTTSRFVPLYPHPSHPPHLTLAFSFGGLKGKEQENVDRQERKIQPQRRMNVFLTIPFGNYFKLVPGS